MPLGISHDQVDRDSFLGLQRELIELPVAASANYFSSASDGGAQAAVSITAATPGTVINRSAQGKRPLFYARRPQLTLVDAAGSSLAVTVRLVGRRFGKLVVQDISGTGSSTNEGTRVIDELVSATIVAIANAAASDTAAIGFDGKWLGLKCPLRSRADVRMAYKIAAGTPDAAGPKVNADVTAAMVNLRDSALDVHALYGSTLIAVTDRYLLEYVAAGSGNSFFVRKGARLG
jgi:hypothetical protein